MDFNETGGAFEMMPLRDHPDPYIASPRIGGNYSARFHITGSSGNGPCKLRDSNFLKSTNCSWFSVA
jgi:hypothetical protein